MDPAHEAFFARYKDAHAIEVASLDRIAKSLDLFAEIPDVRKKFENYLEICKKHVTELENGFYIIGIRRSARATSQ